VNLLYYIISYTLLKVLTLDNFDLPCKRLLISSVIVRMMAIRDLKTSIVNERQDLYQKVVMDQAHFRLCSMQHHNTGHRSANITHPSSEPINTLFAAL
jgi:hypothetical protein